MTEHVPTRAVAAIAAVVLLFGLVRVATAPGSTSEALDSKPPVAITRTAAPTTGAPKAAPPTTPGRTSRSVPAAPRSAAPASPRSAPAVTANPARSLGVTWRSGAFSGDTIAEHTEFGTWRKRQLSTALWFMAQDSWLALENPAYWAAEQAKAPTVTPVLSYALWPASVKGSLAQGATGAYDAHWRTLAKNLVAQGLPKAIIRPGWEFNGDYYPWSVRNDQAASDFAAYWRHLVDAMRSVPGASFEFSWNPVLSGGGVDPAKAYPGDAYVDDIGTDVYNVKERAGLSGASQWQALVDQRYGLAWHKRFAEAHGKKVSFPEWGGLSRPSDPVLAGGDDPVFIRSMFAWMRANPPSYENYFDVDTPQGTSYGLHTTGSTMPKSAAAYRSLWGR